MEDRSSIAYLKPRCAAHGDGVESYNQLHINQFPNTFLPVGGPPSQGYGL
jgi:hypothetical protein